MPESIKNKKTTKFPGRAAKYWTSELLQEDEFQIQRFIGKISDLLFYRILRFYFVLHILSTFNRHFTLVIRLFGFVSCSSMLSQHIPDSLGNFVRILRKFTGIDLELMQQIKVLRTMLFIIPRISIKQTLMENRSTTISHFPARGFCTKKNHIYVLA